MLTGIRSPGRAAEEVNKLFAKHVLSGLRPATDVFDEDWDNLIVLDACRYDLLSEFDFEDGRFEARWSGGSNSLEFLEHNVAGKRLDDTVWVTANPWVERFESDIYAVEHVWDTGWDDEHRTVLPETMKSEAMRAAEAYPRKRIVVHFMQPHYPFLGPTADRELPDYRTFTGGGIISEHSESQRDIWDHLQRGTVSREAVWAAYRENLELTLPCARDLIAGLSGKTVLTADHGNEFGSRCLPVPTRLYGHPAGYRTKNLVKVPWVVFDTSERRPIESGRIRERNAGDSDEVTERLRELGYADPS